MAEAWKEGWPKEAKLTAEMAEACLENKLGKIFLSKLGCAGHDGHLEATYGNIPIQTVQATWQEDIPIEVL